MADAKKMLKKPPPLLPVSKQPPAAASQELVVVTVVGTTKQQKQVAKAKPAAFPGVKVACALALVGALALTAGAGVALLGSPCDLAKSSWWAPCIKLTEAAGAKVIALEHHQLWMGGFQAGVALLELLIPGHRNGLGLVAIALGVANLYLGAVIGNIFAAAAPGNLSIQATNILYIVVFAALYVVAFVALLFQGDDDDE
ncbi:hypothetical protein EJB05_46674 [Eragrostis curvula]|uniref:Uncharacterized protein n=1 Tax=Eragrostis curvula TaxID=38414 RepID=A0A5J9TNN4_9POAL|nr:hypothetical protein EJB05_46674 [Eragrostis curvula]